MRLFVSLSNMLRRHWEGPGGIAALLPIAIPMFLSSMFDMLMMFIDRLFLSRVGVVHQAAAMVGGASSWMVTSFFVGIVGFSSALVAQYLGAGQKTNCVKMVWQALYVGLVSYPLVLIVDSLVCMSPVFSGHSAQETALELRYFWYMSFGSICAILRFAFGSFFSGIGQTRIILIGNTVALVVNFIANWILIFGHFGCPALGLDGAAIGTILSGLSAAVILIFAFLRTSRRDMWRCDRACEPDWSKLFKLIRYGLPQGFENILGMVGFVAIISSFHSYGDDMAAATTICFNWDGVSFHPLLGIQVAVTTLVGQAMGKGDPELAVRSAHSGFKVALFYASCMLLLFLLFTPQLVGVFTPHTAGLDYTAVRAYATPMLRLCGLYLLTDAIFLISTGVLRGAGDTFVCMTIGIVNCAISTTVVVLCARVFQLPPLRAWLYFVILAMLGSMLLLTRYKIGRWKTLRMIELESNARPSL